MSCSCTGNCDLIDIQPLVLSDTFHTWFDRTNEVIDTLSNVNIYDVQVGLTDGGLTSVSGCVSGNYNGLLTIKVAPGPGIGVGTTVTPNYFLNRTMIDVSDSSGMTAYGITGFETNTVSAFPAVDDWYIMSDASDSSLGSGAGTPKRIKAQQILPPTVYLPAGFQFNGNVSINGNLSVQGIESVVDSNNVLIEDKAIEVAYRRFVSVDVTGPTSGTVPNTFPRAGMTFNYFDAGVGSTANPTTIGRISQVTFNGSRTNLKLHAFTVGGVNDIAPLGRISITGSIFDFTMAAGPTVSESFFSDDDLDEAGLIVKGASGDKNLLWVYKEGPSQEVYNAFIASTNLGVSGSSNAIISSKFRSYGYSDTSANNTFQFMGWNTGKPKIILGGATGTLNAYSQYGYWSIQHDNGGGTSTQQPLVWAFKEFSSGSESTRFTIHSGPSGPTYGTITVTGQSNNRVTNFAAGLNVDFLDGAHGTTMPTPWSIPVALTSGTIDEGWIPPQAFKAITRCFNQTSHGLVIGDVVRINPDTGGLTYALATSREYAEVLGVVSSVQGNEVCVVSKGYITGLTGTASSNIYDILPLVTGNVYFLSANDAGGMIADPDSGVYPIGLGEVRKPVMMAVSSNSGYVVNYLGVVEGDDTDLVDVQGIAPVGQIMPFSGTLDKVPYGWLACDGSRLERGMWPELHGIIGQKYYHVGTTDPIYTGSGNVRITLPFSDNFEILENDLISVEGTIGVNTYSASTKIVSVSGNVITVEPFSFGGNAINNLVVKIRGRAGEGGTSIFFLPDFRTRTLIGSIESLGGSFSGINANLGDVGGVTGFSLAASNVPPHSHGMINYPLKYDPNNYVSVGTDSPYYPDDIPLIERTTFAGIQENNYDLGPPAPISIMQPYVTVNFIIRAKKGLSALILSGHNHDDRYHPLNGDISITGAGEIDGDWKVKLSPSTLVAYPQFDRGTDAANSVLRVGWNRVNLSDITKSVGFVKGYGDLLVYTEGITNPNNSSNGSFSAEPIFNLTPKISTLTINGILLDGLPITTPKIEMKVPDLPFGSYGTITGLTSPTQNDYAANKWYADTGSKFIYSPLPVTTAPEGVADGGASNQFAVIAAANTVRTSPKTIMLVAADKDPAAAGRSTTEVHVRGDLQIIGNGMTGFLGTNSMTAHTYSFFSAESLHSKVRIKGGGAYGAGGQVWSPVLSFENRESGLADPVSSKPIGRIEGLTAPTESHEAANKWYVDNSTPSVQIASTSITGVASFDETHFSVDDEGKVSLNGLFSNTTLRIDDVDDEKANPATSTFVGVNIKTRPQLLDSTYAERNVITAFVTDNPNAPATNSNHQVYVNGDFTVFGDGWRGSHQKVTFYVDPRLNSIGVEGGHSVEGQILPPKIVLQDVRAGAARGIIEGLTAPTNSDHAVNKWYVDNRGPLACTEILLENQGIAAEDGDSDDYLNNLAGLYDNYTFINNGTTTTTKSYTGTYNLTPGTWLINVVANMDHQDGDYNEATVKIRAKIQNNNPPPGQFCFIKELSDIPCSFHFMITASQTGKVVIEFAKSNHYVGRISYSAINITPMPTGNP
jgi:microcystin-dependent protein